MQRRRKRRHHDLLPRFVTVDLDLIFQFLGCPEEKYADKSTCYKFDIFIWWCNEWHPRIVWMEVNFCDFEFSLEIFQRLFPIFYLCRVPDRPLTNEVGIQLDQVLSRLLKPHQRISNRTVFIKTKETVVETFEFFQNLIKTPSGDFKQVSEELWGCS